MRVVLNRLLQHDDRLQSLLRHTVILVTIALMLLFGRSLVAEIRHPAASQASSTAREPATTRRRPSALEDAMHVGQAHLFGNTEATATAMPVMTVSDVTLSGVLLSDNQDESLAILVVGGQTVIAAPRQRLPDNEVLRSIAEDRVTLDRNGVLVSVMLDIRKADTNSRTPLIALNADMSGQDAAAAIAPMSGPTNQGQSNSPWTNQQGLQQGLVAHGTFLPLSAIRGDQARLRLAVPGDKPQAAPQQ